MFEFIDRRQSRIRIDCDYFRWNVSRAEYKRDQIQLRLVLWVATIEPLGWADNCRVRWYLDRAEKTIALELDPEGIHGTKFKRHPGNNRRIEVVIPTAVSALVMSWAKFGPSDRKYSAICTANQTDRRLEVKLGERLGEQSHGETEKTNHEHTYIVEPFEGGA